MMLRPYGHRVKKNKEQDRYEVDDMFGVNSHGIALYRTLDGQWHNLCLVVQQAVKPRELDLPGLGPTLLNEITQTILAKIMFLLFPNEERVFMDQLPDHARKHVRHLIKGNTAEQRRSDVQ